jgi:hypothetical protein
MNDSEAPTFGASEVIEITSKFEADDDAFLIGGQATNFWAWFYQNKEEQLKGKGPFTSIDIDYYGSREVARNVAVALQGELKLPAPGDHTPSTAQIVAQIHGKPLVIDFLNAVLGVQQRELDKGVCVLEVGAEVAGQSTTVLVKVLHPLLCLKSRIVSMVHPAIRRRDIIARAQAEAAVIVLRRFIHDALDEKFGWQDAHSCFRELYRHLRQDQYVKRADAEIGIDPLTILKAFTEDQRIDSRYRNMSLKKMIAKIESRRASRDLRMNPV